MKRIQQLFVAPNLLDTMCPSIIKEPPFLLRHLNFRPNEILENVELNPHPTDLLLDTSVFSTKCLKLVHDILLSQHSPILLGPVLDELKDLNRRKGVKSLLDPSRSFALSFQFGFAYFYFFVAVFPSW